MFLLRFLFCFLISGFSDFQLRAHCLIFFPHTSSKKISIQDDEMHLLFSPFFSLSLSACLQLFSQQFSLLTSLTYCILNVLKSLNLWPIKQPNPLIIVTDMGLKQSQFPEKYEVSLCEKWEHK